MKIFSFFLLGLTMSITLAEDLYPNLSCHDGFKAENHVVKFEEKYKHSRGADYYLKKTHEYCKKREEDPGFCLKKCVLDKLQLLNVLTSEDETPKEIELFFNPLEKGKAFTEKIKTSCKDIYKQIELEESCDKWAPFFDCVDKIFNECQR